MNEVKKGGLTALIIIAKESKKEATDTGHQMIIAGSDVNYVGDNGQCALSEAIMHNNKKMAEHLLKRSAYIFHKNQELIDYSPFFQAINIEAVWAIELMCDHGADITTKTRAGMSPMIYAASSGRDEICMYLSLRSTTVDLEDEKSGDNVFSLYLKRPPPDLQRMKQLLMRGANVNFCGIKKLTPLHLAIDNQAPTKVIKFLLKQGANPHIEDTNGLDCCDKAQKIEMY